MGDWQTDREAQRSAQRLMAFLNQNQNAEPFSFAPSDRHAQAWMLLGDRVIRTNEYLRTSGTAQNFMTALQGFASDHSMSDEALAEAYTVGIVAYVCVQRRAQMVASLPLKVMGALGEGTAAHWFVENSSKLLNTAETSMSIWGKNFFHKRRNFMDFPVELEWLNPKHVKVEVERNTGALLRYVAYHHAIAPSDMVYTHNFNPNAQHDSVSPYEVAFKSIATEGNIMQFAASFFLNSARPDAMLSYEGMDLSDADMAAYGVQFRSQFQGVDNAFRTAILPGAGKWVYMPMNSAPPSELAMRDLIQVVRQNVIAVFGLDPILVGLGQASDSLSANSTYQKVWDQHVEFFAVPECETLLTDLNNQWLNEFDDVQPIKLEVDKEKISAVSKATLERAQTALALEARGLYDFNEARQYVGRGEVTGVIPRAGDVAMAYERGAIKRNEWRMHMGLPPVDADGFIYEVDPRQSAPINPFGLPGLSSPALLAQNGKPALALSDGKEAVSTLEPDPAPNDPITRNENVIEGEVRPSEAEWAELRKWRQKQREHAKRCEKRSKAPDVAKFNCEVLSEPLQRLIRKGLEDGWNYRHVFDIAEQTLRAGEEAESEPFGITPEEFEAYWQDLDDLHADLGLAWMDYMVKVSADVEGELLDNPRLGYDYDRIFDAYHADLMADWVGSLDSPGVLTKIILAGMAKGNDIINAEASKRSKRDGGVEISIVWEGLNEDALAFAQAYGFGLIRNIDATTRQQIGDVITQAIDEGWSRAELERALAGILAKGGQPTDAIKKRATLISDTETARAYNAGAENRWQSVGVERGIWQTVRDSIVCPVCRQLHAQVYEIRVGVYSTVLGKIIRQLAHPGCRCFSKPDVSDL